MTFRVEWSGGTAGGSVESPGRVVTWQQTSIPSETFDITGFVLDGEADSSGFLGAGLSGGGNCLIDGDGGRDTTWWNCMAAVNCYGDCIPMRAADGTGQRATNVKLYIGVPDSLPAPVEDSDWELIISQTDAANNLFPSSVKADMVYNQDDSSANPFISMGAL